VIAPIGLATIVFVVMLGVVVLAKRAPDGSGPRLENGALVLQVGRLRQVLIAAGALLFAVVGALMLLTDSVVVQIAGALGVVTFGAFAVIGLWRLRGPWRLVMTPEALRWDHGAAGPAVAWDEITDVGLIVISGSPTLTIDVKRPERLRRGVAGRSLARANHRLGGGDVNVPLGQISVDNELLLSLVTVCAREPEARGTILTEATVRRLQA
jgi:hypothetical protein